MDKWVMFVVLFLLGMLVFHLLKGVCGCKNVVEGVIDASCNTDKDCSGDCEMCSLTEKQRKKGAAFNSGHCMKAYWC